MSHILVSRCSKAAAEPDPAFFAAVVPESGSDGARVLQSMHWMQFASDDPHTDSSPPPVPSALTLIFWTPVHAFASFYYVLASLMCERRMSGCLRTWTQRVVPF